MTLWALLLGGTKEYTSPFFLSLILVLPANADSHAVVSALLQHGWKRLFCCNIGEEQIASRIKTGFHI